MTNKSISGRGGTRAGAGRPKGTKNKEKTNTVNYHRRVKPEFVKKLDNYLNELKTQKTD